MFGVALCLMIRVPMYIAVQVQACSKGLALAELPASASVCDPRGVWHGSKCRSETLAIILRPVRRDGFCGVGAVIEYL